MQRITRRFGKSINAGKNQILRVNYRKYERTTWLIGQTLIYVLLFQTLALAKAGSYKVEKERFEVLLSSC